jgi:DNA repair exonuclease SbcCD ATPase subunit
MVFMPMGYVIDKSEKAKFDRNKSKTGYLAKDIPLLESFRILKDGKPVTGLPLDPEHYRKFIDWLANGPPQPVPPVALRILCHYRSVVEDAKDDINTTDGMRLKQDNLIKTIEELIKGGDDNKDADAMCLTGGSGTPGPEPASDTCCEELKPEIAEIKTTVATLGTKEELDEIKTTMGTKEELDKIKELLEELKNKPSAFDLKAELQKILNGAPAAAAAPAEPGTPAAPDQAVLHKLEEILAKLGNGSVITDKLTELETALNELKPPPPGTGPPPLDPAFQALVTDKLTKIDADLEGFKKPMVDFGLIKGIMEKGFADLSGAIHNIGQDAGEDAGEDDEDGDPGAPAAPAKKINLAGIHKLLTDKFTELDRILAILKPSAEGAAETNLEGFLKAKFNEISNAIAHIVIPTPDFKELEAHIHLMFEELKTHIKGQAEGGANLNEIRTLITEMKTKEGVSAEDLAKLDGLLKNLPKPAGDISPALEEIKGLIKNIVVPPPVVDFSELKDFITKLKGQKSLSDEDLTAIDELIKKVGPGKDYEDQLKQILDGIRTPGGGVITEVSRLLDQLKTLPSLKQEDKDAIKQLLDTLPKAIDYTQKLSEIEAAVKEIKPVDLEGIKTALEALKTQASLKAEDKAAIEEIISKLIKNPTDHTALLEELKASLAGIKADPSLKEVDLTAIRDILKEISPPPGPDYRQILGEIKALVEGLNMAELKAALQTIIATKPLDEETTKRIFKEESSIALAGLQTDVADLKDELAKANENILKLLARKAPKANLEDRAAEALAKMDKAEHSARAALERLKAFDVAQASPNAMEELTTEAKKQQARAQLYKEEAEELYAMLDQANVDASAEAGQVEQPNVVQVPPPGGQKGGAAKQLREAKASSAEGTLKNLGEKLAEFNLQIKEKRKSPKPEDCGPLHARITELEAELAAKEKDLLALRQSLKGKNGNAQATAERAALLLAEVAKLKATIKKVTGEVPDDQLNSAVNAHLAKDETDKATSTSARERVIALEAELAAKEKELAALRESLKGKSGNATATAEKVALLTAEIAKLKATIKKVTGEVPDDQLNAAVNTHLTGDAALKTTIKKVTGDVKDEELDPTVVAHMHKYRGFKKTIKKITGEGVADTDFNAKVTEHMLEYNGLKARLVALEEQIKGTPDISELRIRLQKEIAKAAELQGLIDAGAASTGDIEGFRRRVGELEAEVLQLRTKGAQDAAKIAGLEKELRDLKAGCQAKEAEAARVTRELATAMAELGPLRLQITQLRGGDSEAKRQLEADLAACRATVATLTRQKAELDGIIKGMQAEIGSLRTALAAAQAAASQQPPQQAYQPPQQAYQPPQQSAPAREVPSYMRTTESRKSAIQGATNQLSDLGSGRVGRGVNSFVATKKQPVAKAVNSRPAWKRGGATKKNKKGARLRKIKENINPM